MGTRHTGRKSDAGGTCHDVITLSPPAQRRQWALQDAPAPVPLLRAGLGPLDPEKTPLILHHEPTCSEPAAGSAGCTSACASASAGGCAGPLSAKAAPMMTSRLSAGEGRDARAWDGGRGGRCRQDENRVLEDLNTCCCCRTGCGQHGSRISQPAGRGPWGAHSLRNPAGQAAHTTKAKSWSLGEGHRGRCSRKKVVV